MQSFARTGSPTHRIHLFVSGETYRVAVATCVLTLVFAVVVWNSPGLLRWAAINRILLDGAPFLLLVIGLTLPVLLGCLDLSVAALASLAAVVCAILAGPLGSWAVPAVVAGGTLIGAAQGYISARVQIPSFILTLGSLGVFSGMALFLSGDSTIAVDGGLFFFNFLTSKAFLLPNAVWLVLAWLVLLSAILGLTRLGRDINAVGASELAAYISGVNRGFLRALAFAISGMCASLAGVMLLSQTLYASSGIANTLLLPTLVGVVLGGTAISGGVGTLTGSVIGGLIVVLVRVGTAAIGLPGATQDIIFGVVVLIAVAITTDRSKIGVIK
ncbi:ABC transporter permease [Methylobacterium aquaticum]|uniref:ABC transporter permease n=1 Tax=Methylobacterium aquaticum TaxID=270351 RepID=UPI003D173E47